MAKWVQNRRESIKASTGMNETELGKQPATDSKLGKRLVLLLLALATGAAGFGWWWHYEKTRRPRALWGPAHALRIRDAQTIEAWRVEPGLTGPGTPLAVGPVPYRVVETRDARQVLGVRDLTQHALLSDFAFDWQANLAACQPQYLWALQLGDEHGQTTLLFAPACHQILMLQTGAQAQIQQPVSNFTEKFFERTFSSQPPIEPRQIR